MPPTVTRQLPPKPTIANGMIKPSTDILGTGVPVGEMLDLYINLALYGRNRIGKTTLACMAPKPLALLSIEPSPTGGARSVKNTPGITVFRIAGRPLIDARTGKLESIWGSQKALAIADAMKARFAAGERPFESVVIDGITSWNEVVLQEVLGVPTDDMPAILSFGKVSQEQYGERAEKIIRYVRPFIDLPVNTIIIAQEKDHNPPRDDKNRVLGNKLIRGMQEESFFSLDVGAAPAKWIQDACDFVGQLYQDAETKEQTANTGIKDTQGKYQTYTEVVRTGRIVRRLRTLYHPNYASGFRSPDYKVVPEYIQAESPEEMWAELMKVIQGKKTDKGKYNT